MSDIEVMRLFVGNRASEQQSAAKGSASALRPHTLAEFEAVALPHLNELFRTAQRVLKDESRAEDVIQEVYLQAWKSFSRFQLGTNCRAWLYRILFHTINHDRRRWLRLRIFSDLETQAEEHLTWTPPIPQTITDEEILAALDKIPQDFKSVVLLVDVQEFSYKEVSEILEIPIGTVMSRLSRGRGLLRTHLATLATTLRIAQRTAEEQKR